MSSSCKDVQKYINDAMKDIDKLRQEVVKLKGIVARIRSTLMTNSVNSGISWQERQACKNMLEHLDKLCADTSVESSPAEAVVREAASRIQHEVDEGLKGGEMLVAEKHAYESALQILHDTARKHGLEVG